MSRFVHKEVISTRRERGIFTNPPMPSYDPPMPEPPKGCVKYELPLRIPEGPAFTYIRSVVGTNSLTLMSAARNQEKVWPTPDEVKEFHRLLDEQDAAETGKEWPHGSTTAQSRLS